MRGLWVAASTDHRSADGGPSGVRLSELVAVLSFSSDFGLGQPMEHVLRSCLIALRLADRLGLDERAALRDLLGHAARDGVHRGVVRARADVRQRGGVPVGHLPRGAVPARADGARARAGRVEPVGAGPGARGGRDPREQREDGRGQVPRALRADERDLAAARPGSRRRRGAVAHLRAVGRQGHPARRRPRRACRCRSS